ncbi:hypothetical protein FJZ22_01175 [Candidatus Pacearchaeota archaeon]|nr:hypothetical protein [Candidatus Pacearchaeota archaeon]
MNWLLAVVTAIFISSFTSALSFSAPSSIEMGDSFTLTLSHEDSTTADIKLFVQAQELQNLSKIIVDGKEKSTFYYLKGVFPTQTSFTLKIVQTGINPELCVRLRKVGKTAYEETCQPLTIALSQSNQEEEKEEEQKEPLSKKEKKEKKPITPLSISSQSAIHTISPPQNNLSPLYLNTLSEPSFEQTTIWKISFFTLICFGILVLLVLGKI